MNGEDCRTCRWSFVPKGEYSNYLRCREHPGSKRLWDHCGKWEKKEKVQMDVPMCKDCIEYYSMEVPQQHCVGTCACCSQSKIVFNITYDYIDKFNEKATFKIPAK